MLIVAVIKNNNRLVTLAGLEWKKSSFGAD